MPAVQVLYERCAGIDVHKDQVTVAVRVPGSGPGGRDTRVRKFGAFYGVLREMARWLASQRVTHVAMEATGVYTMPVYHALLEPGVFEQVLVCNAAHVKNVPGRKTDAVDASWLAELLECGLVKGSFIPPEEVKAVRDVIRYRRKIVQQRASETQRLGGVLQDAQLTELRERIVMLGRPASTSVARFPAHDQLRGWRARPVVAEGAALRSA